MEPLPTVSMVVARLRARGVELSPGVLRVAAYGDCPELSSGLLSLIREGRKRAGTSLLWAVEADNEADPKVGDVEIVVDHRKEPVFLTRITQIQVVPWGKKCSRLDHLQTGLYSSGNETYRREV